MSNLSSGGILQRKLSNYKVFTHFRFSMIIFIFLACVKPGSCHQNSSTEFWGGITHHAVSHFHINTLRLVLKRNFTCFWWINPPWHWLLRCSKHVVLAINILSKLYHLIFIENVYVFEALEGYWNKKSVSGCLLFARLAAFSWLPCEHYRLLHAHF